MDSFSPDIRFALASSKMDRFRNAIDFLLYKWLVEVIFTITAFRTAIGFPCQIFIRMKLKGPGY